MSDGRDKSGRFTEGNNGRPKGTRDRVKGVKQIIDDYMDSRDPKQEDSVSRWHALIKEIYHEAIYNHNARAAIYLIDRKLGKPMQEIKVGGGKPIAATVHLHVNGNIKRIPDGE